MKISIKLACAACIMFAAGRASGDSSVPAPSKDAPDPLPVGAAPGLLEASRRADKRYEEMLDRMQAAVEQVAELYGNPIFLQVFTNDTGRASELKLRLKASRSSEDISRDLAGLEKKRDDLLSDIALKEREAARLASKLARQRAALDTLESAVEQARKAVEDTAK